MVKTTIRAVTVPGNRIAQGPGIAAFVNVPRQPWGCDGNHVRQVCCRIVNALRLHTGVFHKTTKPDRGARCAAINTGVCI
jgi:hypothetical protein